MGLFTKKRMGRKLPKATTVSKTKRIKLRDDLTDDVKNILESLNNIHLDLRLFLDELTPEIENDKDLRQFRRLKNISTAIQECIE